MAQLLEPVSTSANAWALTGDSSAHLCIDETIAAADDGTTYIQVVTDGDVCTVGLTTTGYKPLDLTAHVVTVRGIRTVSGTVTVLVELLQGTGSPVVIASTTISFTSGTYSNKTLTLSSVEAGSITDYSHLFVRLTGHTSGSAKPRITTVEFSMATGRGVVADVGSFTFGGKDASLKSARKVTSAVGVFSLTGIAAGLQFGRKVSSATGSFTLTGQVAALRAARTLPIGSGTFALSGLSAGLYRGFPLVAASGSFSLTGRSAGLLLGRALAIGPGTFTLSGIAAGLLRGYPLPAGAGVFTLAGQNVGLLAGRKLPISAGAFVLTGIPAGFIVAHGVPAGPGSFALSGQAAALRADRRLDLGSGTFSFSGIAAGLFFGRALVLGPGGFTLTGQAAGLRAARLLSVAPGSFVLTGIDASLSNVRGVLAGSGTFLLAGQAVGLSSTRKIVALAGGFVLSGRAAGLAITRLLGAARGSFSFTGNDADLRRVRSLVAGSGPFVLVGQPAGLIFDQIVILGCLALVGREIRTRFDSLVTTALSIPTQWDNQPLEPTLPFCRFAVDIGEFRQRTFGAGNRYRITGTLRANFYSKIESGDASALTLADAAADAFRLVTGSLVVYGVPSARELGRDGDRWAVEVSCPFRADCDHDLLAIVPGAVESFSDLALVARTRFETLVGIPESLPTQWDNQPLDPPSGSSWARVRVLPAGDNLVELGVRNVRTRGAVQVLLAVPIESGDHEARRLADLVAEAFRGVTESGVVFTEPYVQALGILESVGTGQRASATYKVAVTCPFWWDRILA